MDKLLTFLRSLSPLSSENWQLLQPALVRKTFKKHEYLLREGEVCHTLFYMETGCCRSFVVIDGLEKNTGFFFEDEIATELNSFGSGQKAQSSIVSCELLEAVLFDKDKLFAAARISPEIASLGRHCIRRFALRQEEFSKLLRLYAPQDRVLFLEQHYPEMFQRIPLSQLASFLGVTRESLSRIRRRRMQS